MKVAPAPVLAALLVVLPGCLDLGEDPPAALPPPDDPVPVPDARPEPPPLALAFALAGFYPANPAFDPPRAMAPAGTPLAVSFTNSDLNPLGKHDWTLERADGTPVAATEVIDQGVSQDVAVPVLEPGEYPYFCAVPGHRGRGMVGVLVVEPPTAMGNGSSAR